MQIFSVQLFYFFAFLSEIDDYGLNTNASSLFSFFNSNKDGWSTVNWGTFGICIYLLEQKQ